MSNLAKKRTGKGFIHKVYDRNDNYLTTWSAEVTNVPSFTMNINAGMGIMNIKLARAINNCSEGIQVAVRNRIETYVTDDDNQYGTKIFDGRIL